MIPATIYPSNIYIFKGFTYESAKKHLVNIYKDALDFIILEMFDEPGYTILLPDGSVIILLRSEYCTNMSIISHEAFHAVEFIMDRVDIKHCEETSEVFAYFLGYIVEEITTK